MKVKCKLVVDTSSLLWNSVYLKYKLENKLFYKKVYIQISDIFSLPEKYTPEQFNIYNMLDDECIIKELAKMSSSEIKELCKTIIKKEVKPKQDNNLKTELKKAINKIDNMKFEIELD